MTDRTAVPTLPNPTLLGFRDKVIKSVKDTFTNLRSVDAVRGAMTEEGLERLTFKPPGVKVAVLGIKDLKPVDTATYKVTALMSMFIITDGRDRLDLGLNLMEALSLHIAGNTWGVPFTEFPEEIKGEPIYDDRYRDRQERTSHLQENGVLLQGLSWTQRTRVVRVPPSEVGARKDDVDTASALGQAVDDRRWPEKMGADFAPGQDYTPVRDTPGDNRTEESD